MQKWNTVVLKTNPSKHKKTHVEMAPLHIFWRSISRSGYTSVEVWNRAYVQFQKICNLQVLRRSLHACNANRSPSTEQFWTHNQCCGSQTITKPTNSPTITQWEDTFYENRKNIFDFFIKIENFSFKKWNRLCKPHQRNLCQHVVKMLLVGANPNTSHWKQIFQWKLKNESNCSFPKKTIFYVKNLKEFFSKYSTANVVCDWSN